MFCCFKTFLIECPRADLCLAVLFQNAIIFLEQSGLYCSIKFSKLIRKTIENSLFLPQGLNDDVHKSENGLMNTYADSYK